MVGLHTRDLVLIYILISYTVDIRNIYIYIYIILDIYIYCSTSDIRFFKSPNYS